MVAVKRPSLVLVLGVVLTLINSQVQQLEGSTVSTNSIHDSISNGVEESESTSRSWSSAGPFSQQRLLRALQVKRLAQQDDSGAIHDWVDQLSSKRASNKGKDATNGVPAQQTLDMVKELPGQPKVDFAQYAGYVTVNQRVGRALFYYLVEATTRPETKPLILWLNGGPGCSSLAFGAFSEMGPFRVNSDGKTLSFNKYAWNKEANILFLESPVGVGFSYSNDTSEYTNNGDIRTAADSLIFLVDWFLRFPQYNNRDFFIAGESYAGHYVPQLAELLYRYNKGQPNSYINLKGILVGNGVIDDRRDALGAVDYLWSHVLISNDTYVPLRECILSKDFRNNCSIEEAYLTAGQIDPYNIYAPLCINGTSVSQSSKSPDEPSYDACFESHVVSYFNRQDVQEALHANVTKLSYPWDSCNIDTVFVNWKDSAFTIIPIYKKLIAAGLRILLYSGDVDAVVPATSTLYSLALLNLKKTTPWCPWNASNGEVGGYRQGYDGITYMTVRGAGHEVPLFQPSRSLTLFTSYIRNIPFS